MLGQHTQEVLQGLGYDDANIKRLEQNGVVRIAPEVVPP
jgi:crotonobetainyl-CoA:carnitine CoA-transferase CaiB-like acyl-CoA transferase